MERIHALNARLNAVVALHKPEGAGPRARGGSGARARGELGPLHGGELRTSLDELTSQNEEFGGDDVKSKSYHMRDHGIPAMVAGRAAADCLEKVVPDDYWPLPTYRDMLSSGDAVAGSTEMETRRAVLEDRGAALWLGGRGSLFVIC